MITSPNNISVFHNVLVTCLTELQFLVHLTKKGYEWCSPTVYPLKYTSCVLQLEELYSNNTVTAEINTTFH